MDPNIIIGIVGIVIGAILTIVIYLLGRARLELTWSVEHNLLIENSKTNIDGLEVKFNGQDITSLKSTMLTIKNTGNRHLTREHIAKSGILFSHGIPVDDLISVDLLEEDVAKPNEYMVFEKTDKVTYKFRFSDMAKKDFVRIQILHTAEDNPEINFAKGTLKDGKIVGGNVKLSPQKEAALQGLSIASVVYGLIVFVIDEYFSRFRGYSVQEFIDSLGVSKGDSFLLAAYFVMATLSMTAMIGAMLIGLSASKKKGKRKNK